MHFHDTVWCDGCGVEIAWPTQSQASLHFCCATCFAGELCDCSTRLELDDDRRAVATPQPLMVAAGD
jgi:hypothetical protein